MRKKIMFEKIKFLERELKGMTDALVDKDIEITELKAALNEKLERDYNYKDLRIEDGRAVVRKDYMFKPDEISEKMTDAYKRRFILEHIDAFIDLVNAMPLYDYKSMKIKGLYLLYKTREKNE